MFRFIKKIFITLLYFGGSLATNHISLNKEACTARQTLNV